MTGLIRPNGRSGPIERVELTCLRWPLDPQRLGARRGPPPSVIRPGAGERFVVPSTNDLPQRRTPPIPAATVERLAVLLDLAYEASWTLCDRGRADWSTVGSPIAEALRIVRGIRDGTRQAAA